MIAERLCPNNHCTNGGICYLRGTSHYCKCRENYVGFKCEGQ